MNHQCGGIRRELMTEIKEERAKKESIKGEKIKTRKIFNWKKIETSEYDYLQRNLGSFW